MMSGAFIGSLPFSPPSGLGSQFLTLLAPSGLMGWLEDSGLGVKAYFSSRHEWFATVVLGVFTFTNSLRVLAYVPQMLKAAQDENGASAVSYSTWTLFLISHLTTIAYALVCLGDLVMAFIFLGNAFACLTIIAITFVKRKRYAARLRAAE
jgi:ABC-type molybdate transport system permease subunit